MNPELFDGLVFYGGGNYAQAKRRFTTLAV